MTEPRLYCDHLYGPLFSNSENGYSRPNPARYHAPRFLAEEIKTAHPKIRSIISGYVQNASVSSARAKPRSTP